MRDAIAWSHDLLDAGERAQFRQLAVFTGGFTLDAAEAVSRDEGAAAGRREGGEGGTDGADYPSLHSAPSSALSPQHSVLDTLASLVDKNLVRQVEGAVGEPRFRMLETIREYALEQLAASGETGAIRERHAEWCLAFSKQVDAELDGLGMFPWLLRVEAEHDNLRAAITWLKQRGDTGSALRLGAGLSAFWWYRGHFSEGRAQLEALLALPGARDHPYAWARAMTGLGTLQYKTGNVPLAARLHEQAVAVWRDLGDRERLGYALWCQGLALGGTDDDLAMAALTECQATGEALNMPWMALPCQWALGRIARYHGDNQRAEELITEALRSAREFQHPIGIPLSLIVLGCIALDQGAIDRAASHLGEGLEYLRDISGRWGTSGRLKGVAAVAAAPWGIPICLEALGAVAGVRGEATRAARIFGNTAALREAVGYARETVDQPGYERWVAPVKTALGDAGYAAAWSEGQTMTLDDVVADALTIAERATNEEKPREQNDNGGSGVQNRPAAVRAFRTSA
jgi:hypothetical protein